MSTTLPGTGVLVATDDIAGVAHQLVKVEFGAAGAATPVSAANPLPVTNGLVQGLTDTQLRATAVPVSGSFFQATQPVSIASMPSTPVTGAFFQSTQPVSAATLPLPTGAATEVTAAAINATLTAGTVQLAAGAAIGTTPSARAVQVSGSDYGGTPLSRAIKVDSSGFQYIGNFPATQAVSGTFWQATQPVSIASMPSTPVTGTFFQATQPVSIAATINTSATVSNFPATQAVSLATNTPDVTDRAARVLGVVTQAPLTKGTQGANGVTTQDLKDSGRVAISFTAEFSPVAVAEAMLTMSVSKDGATATTTTSYVITSGKRLRVASKSIAVENTLGTSIQRAYLRTRFAVTGGALITSPLQANVIATAAGTVKSTGSNFDDYPDGLEFLGDGTKAIGWSLQAPDWVTASATLKVYVTIIAFEY